MCFSTQSSFLAWTLSYSIAIYLYLRNQNYDRWNAAFIISFSSIQLIEAGIWSTIDESPSNINSLLTCMILLVLLSQPLVQTYMGYKNVENASSKKTLYIASILFIILFGIGLYRVSKNGSSFSSTVGPNGHLIWNDPSSSNSSFLGSGLIISLYLLGLFIPLLFMKEYRGIPLLVIGLITFFYNLKYSGTNEFGSMWCFSAVAYSMVALFV